MTVLQNCDTLYTALINTRDQVNTSGSSGYISMLKKPAMSLSVVPAIMAW